MFKAYKITFCNQLYPKYTVSGKNDPRKHVKILLYE